MSPGPKSFLPPLKDNQGAASDPSRHVWLSASAGTGKTQVLSARVYRLLLRGVAPLAILCLTFTKAGATEMAARISGTLARWVRESDDALFNDLRALGEAGDPAQRRLARTLFARVLDAPGGGLRIQTIHSFCQSLLAGFPVEAGLVPGFRPLEAREEALLAREALADMLVAEEAAGRRRLVDAVGALSLRLGEGGAEAFLLACARAPDAMDALPSGIAPWLTRALDLPAGDIAAYVENYCGDDAFDCAALRQVIDANHAWGTATGRTHAGIAQQWLDAPVADRVAGLQAIASLFLTGKGEPRKASTKLLALMPDYPDVGADLAEVCSTLLGLIARAGYAELLAGGLEAGRAYAAAYRAAKRRMGAVDFDDLIRATVDLLAQPGMGDWVRYKLDQGTDHVLIDEAQDTNPRQWAIVRSLADEFFAGDGARAGVDRTLFTVGDYKQAIFGFQGTSPEYFRAAHRHFTDQSMMEDDDGRVVPRLGTLSLTASFRSTRPVLEFVDAAVGALADPGMGGGVEIEDHASEVPGPGTVELWPVTTVDTGDDAGGEEGWIDDATRALARRIARTIKGWIGTLPLESKGRMLRPEDIMILVKRRGELAALIVARLYAEGVPVAGVDRLRLNAPLAVQDLLAAVRFVLQPDDDLTLASLLVSPLIGWSQDELMHAAMRDGRGSLWRHLRATQPEERLAPLRAMLARADFTTPYRFLEELLSGSLDGRRKLVRRLGEEARDPIEELLGAALSFEATSTPSLQRFLDWFDRGEVEIVRDPSAPLDAVRVMTAHGAKGLQAPLVILADATADPANARRDIVTWTVEGVDIPIFRPRAAERIDSPLDPVIVATEARELEEHWRLFYVAATRAEERLVVAGALGSRPLSDNSWYAASARALDALGVAAADDAARSFQGREPQLPVVRQAAPAPAAVLPAVPDWATRPAPQEARPSRPLAPSSLGDDAVADPPPTAAMRAAAERGRLLHALFERLPAIDPVDRNAAALRWLEVSGGVADAAVRDDIARAACGIIGDPNFAELFGANSLAEAPIAATVGGVVIAGTVDRLVVTPDRVRVVDFKTGRRAPLDPGEIPPYHLRQMAAYVSALQVIFPGRRVEAALLYTSAPRMFVLGPDILAAHKPDLAATEQSLPSRA